MIFFLHRETTQIEPMLVMIFNPIALLFAPFLLLLQVASLDELNHVSDIILMTSSCMRHNVGDILTYPT